MGETNLLKGKNTIIPSSTSIGFALEEFVSVNLEKIWENASRNKVNSAISNSYDLLYENNNDYIMINLKSQKKGSKNNAIAAIKNLKNDYEVLMNDSNYTKHNKAFCVAKLLWYVDDNKIHINDYELFFLEEYSHINHKQDNRNWNSKANNLDNGRMQITKKYMETYKKEECEISFENTYNEIKNLNKGKQNERT